MSAPISTSAADALLHLAGLRCDATAKAVLVTMVARGMVNGDVLVWPFSFADLAELLEVSERTVRSRIGDMTTAGLLSRLGRNPSASLGRLLDWDGGLHPSPPAGGRRQTKSSDSAATAANIAANPAKIAATTARTAVRGPRGGAARSATNAGGSGHDRISSDSAATAANIAANPAKIAATAAKATAPVPSGQRFRNMEAFAGQAANIAASGADFAASESPLAWAHPPAFQESPSGIHSPFLDQERESEWVDQPRANDREALASELPETTPATLTPPAGRWPLSLSEGTTEGSDGPPPIVVAMQAWEAALQVSTLLPKMADRVAENLVRYGLDAVVGGARSTGEYLADFPEKLVYMRKTTKVVDDRCEAEARALKARAVANTPRGRGGRRADPIPSRERFETPEYRAGLERIRAQQATWRRHDPETDASDELLAWDTPPATGGL